MAALRWRELDVIARGELVRRVDALYREPAAERPRERFDAAPSRYREPAGFKLGGGVASRFAKP